MAIQTAPWYAVAGDFFCPQCEVLLERRTVLDRSSRLHTKLDGYAIYSFACPCNDCGWKSGDILVKFDLPATFNEASEAEPAERPIPAIVIPTEEEVEVLSAKPKPLTSKVIDLPEAEPVPLEELQKFIIENSPNELRLKDGLVLRRKVEKQELEGKQGESVGIVRLIYSDGNNAKSGAFHFNQGEASFMTTNGLPDMKESMERIKASISGDLKLQTQNPQRAPVAPPKFNKAGSRVKGICGCEGCDAGDHKGLCGAAPGECECPGKLKMRNPGSMKHQTWALDAPDGSPVVTMKDRLEAEAGFALGEPASIIP